MSLTKVNYIDNSTIITAKNLNDIQDNIIQNAQLIKKAAPRNLLNNSDFRNPVNQRGYVSGTNGNDQYCIDRWKLQYGTNITLMDGFIRLGGQYNFWQYISSNLKAGKMYTCAAKVKASSGTRLLYFYTRDNNSNALASAGGVTLDEEWRIVTMTFTAQTDIVNAIVEFHQSNDTIDVCTDIAWAALYEGAYTIDTLPEYQPKGYEQELLICRQYDGDNYIGLRKFSQPRNLLDNSDFRNPVNQRGQTEYTDGYSIDRWYLWSSANDGKVTLNNGYISIYSGSGGCTFTQRLESGILDRNKTYTMAYKKLDGTVGVFPAVIDYNFAPGIDLLTLVNLNSRTEDVVWGALYEGEYTIDTLPEYQPKGYGAELAECQRYYRQEMVLPAYQVSGSLYMLSHVCEMRDMGIYAPSTTLIKFTKPDVIDITSFAPNDDIGIEIMGNGKYLLSRAYLSSCSAYDLGMLRFNISADL